MCDVCDVCVCVCVCVCVHAKGPALTSCRTNTTTSNITVPTGVTLSVNGTLILLDGSQTVITLNPSSGLIPIVVSGAIFLNGSLVITLTESVSDGRVVPIITGSGTVSGSFDDITVTGRSCQSLSGSGQQTGTSGFGVLVSVTSDRCKGNGLSKVRITLTHAFSKHRCDPYLTCDSHSLSLTLTHTHALTQHSRRGRLRASSSAA